MRLGPEYNPLPASFCECGGGTTYLDEGVLTCAKCGKARRPVFESPATRLAEVAEQAERRDSIVENKNRSIQILARGMKEMRARVAGLEAQLAASNSRTGEPILNTRDVAEMVGRSKDWVRLNKERLGYWKDPTSGYLCFYESRVRRGMGAVAEGDE